MTKEEIEHLASLSRIALTAAEVAAFEKDISSILEYVSTVNAISGDDAVGPQAGTHYNIFRADTVTNEPESYTEALLAAMPEREGRFMKVKKILQQEDE